MKIKSFLAKPFAAYIYKGIRKDMLSATSDQDSILKQLIKIGRITEYGKEHGLANVNSYEEFRQAIPILDYEQLRPYIQKIKEGKLTLGKDAKAKIKAEIVDHMKGDSVIAYKQKRRKGFHKKKGHRTLYTRIKVTSIA